MERQVAAPSVKRRNVARRQGAVSAREAIAPKSEARGQRLSQSCTLRGLNFCAYFALGSGADPAAGRSPGWLTPHSFRLALEDPRGRESGFNPTSIPVPGEGPHAGVRGTLESTRSGVDRRLVSAVRQPRSSLRAVVLGGVPRRGRDRGLSPRRTVGPDGHLCNFFMGKALFFVTSSQGLGDPPDKIHPVSQPTCSGGSSCIFWMGNAANHSPGRALVPPRDDA
jgi:hypothetical protein